MNRDQKAVVIDQIATDIGEAQAIFAVDYRGITVAQADALRQRLREADASFRVVKNSLTERAAERAGADALRPLLQGPTALTFVKGDAAAAAKAVADFARTTQLLAFKGGIMDGAALSAADVGAISRLPSRDVLYGQLVGLVASPIAGLARTLNALVGGLAVALDAVRGKMEAGEIPSGHSTSAAEANAGGDLEEGDGAAGAETVEASADVDAADGAAAGEDAPAEADEADAPEEAEVAAETHDDPAAAAEAPVARTELVTDEGSAPAASGDDEKEDQ